MPRPLPRRRVRVAVGHYSLRYSVRGGRATREIRRVLAMANRRSQAWFTLTEVGPETDIHDEIKRQAGSAGFRVVIWRSNAVCVRKSRIVPGTWSTGGVLVAKTSEVAGPGHDSGFVWAEWTDRVIGDTSVAGTHYPTGWRDNRNRPIVHRMARALGRWGDSCARRGRLVWVGGDFNMPDQSADVFLGEPFTTAADERRHHPTTGHGPIDGIASYDGNTNVRAFRWTVFPDRRVFFASDHYPTEAVFEVHLDGSTPSPHVPEPEPEAPTMPTATLNARVIKTARERYGVNILTRAEWGTRQEALYQRRRRTHPVKVRLADTVVQHISVTRRDTLAEDMRELEAIGMSRFGSGVSYNWGVDMVTGQVGEGQPLDAKGTHTVNHKRIKGYSYDQNAVARAICVIGMPGQPLSAKAERAIAGLLAAMMDEGAITTGFDYDPHSKFTAKDCPCDATRDAMPEIRRMAVALRAGNTPTPSKAPAPAGPSKPEQTTRQLLTRANRAINQALETLKD